VSHPEQRPAPAVGAPNRSSQEIRRDIEVQREELGRSVETLRARVGELTDWRRQVREHRGQLIAGAAVAGFVIGGIIALRRRR
jgi:Protein of unknown function (DUF3618)